MPIIKKSDETIRSAVLQYLSDKRGSNPDYRVIDIGGARNPWCDQYVDAYADINPLKSSKEVFSGDINEADVWKEISRHRWDFSICTHTLEDIRSPHFVLRKLMEISKAGFIAVPNKHTELHSIRSHCYVGYSHHRWIFTINGDDCLMIIAKWPCTSYFTGSKALLHLLGKIPFLAKVERALGFRPGGGSLTWLNKNKVDPERFELGFLWENAFDFKFINNDYAGDNEVELMNLYRHQLKDGL